MADALTNGSSNVVTQVLADLGPVLTGERDLRSTAIAALQMVLSAAHASSGALFRFQDKPAMLASIAHSGFALFPQTAVFPLLPKHIHALNHASGAQRLCKDRCDTFLSSTGNVSGVWFHCIAPLRVRGKLIGALLLGEREGGAEYSADLLAQIGQLAPYIALAIFNHQLITSLEERTKENLRLIASVHSFWEDALLAFAATIDVKHVNMHGHSLRVGRYSAGMAETLGMNVSEITELRAAGYLHDIGKVTVDKHIFTKPGALAPAEFQEMADHTVEGHRIVSTVQFPWPNIPEVVRSHHERADGSGYPDHLHSDEVSVPVKVVAVADCFDAMLSERPYRKKRTLGETAAELSWLAPAKMDADVVHALLVQLRRDAARLIAPQRPWGSVDERPRRPFLDSSVPCNISPTDIDHLVSELNRRVNHGRTYSA
ncbi:MAG TPA: HD domain-containing phosphohydrolase [Verrucomicrobiae bacterium]|jgi:putative nucleotidyltransferase with HDIG domain|nr:HD domain-containing phosphohydrolase [Verrucomicrobiae bacterium]